MTRRTHYLPTRAHALGPYVVAACGHTVWVGRTTAHPILVSCKRCLKKIPKV